MTARAARLLRRLPICGERADDVRRKQWALDDGFGDWILQARADARADHLLDGHNAREIDEMDDFGALIDEVDAEVCPSGQTAHGFARALVQLERHDLFGVLAEALDLFVFCRTKELVQPHDCWRIAAAATLRLTRRQRYEQSLREDEGRGPECAGVYFVQAGPAGLIKIGKADNIRQRVRSLQTASPIALVCIGHLRGGLALESEMHRRFAVHRVRGEWFHPATEILAIAAAGSL